MTKGRANEDVRMKRVYEAASPADGYRALVDRLWPRGLSKEKAALDDWLKDIAPSTELRSWFGHQPEKWTEFSRRYKAELKQNRVAVDHLLDIIRKQERVTLLYAAADEQHTHALVLQAYLLAQLK